ncbi:fatty acid desaturase type 2 [Segniliparus rotundus DSM 44985]|uniref:Fatty acid desaturase type 2 n=1 Tax=Segniliparus rotundus (strain ATCC BAA-972 / CDC 1076 / CIP 108378 / DSM 44985 / JCM 13578) TaxID=640132 RepID=D6Z9S6_SEGRD|nr:acyl-ACP desaturase [Segniliparus rotundus]ADG96603.1 fatty acid desaturase type 2 [Segniliparus rotundus DSM 44985]
MVQRELSDKELLHELYGVAEDNVNRHLKMAKDWNPHDYIPWSEGKNFKMLGGEDWELGQSQLDEPARIAMLTNLVTEDNLPAYHRDIADAFSRDSAWGTWVGRWTAEENRHSIAIRDYLLTTRAVDPVELERARVASTVSGFNPPMAAQDMLHTVCYVTFQELATRVSHRNTGKACKEPIADKLLQRISADENLHMIFYRNLVEQALNVSPNQTMKAIADILTMFQMPGAGMKNFRRNAVIISKSGIYDLKQHMEDVVMPVLRHWKIFERDDFSGYGEWERDRLAEFLRMLNGKVQQIEESQARRAERLAARDAARAS